LTGGLSIVTITTDPRRSVRITDGSPVNRAG
jgi:hypothetical protein